MEDGSHVGLARLLGSGGVIGTILGFPHELLLAGKGISSHKVSLKETNDDAAASGADTAEGNGEGVALLIKNTVVSGGHDLRLIRDEHASSGDAKRHEPQGPQHGAEDGGGEGRRDGGDNARRNGAGDGNGGGVAGNRRASAEEGGGAALIISSMSLLIVGGLASVAVDERGVLVHALVLALEALLGG